MSSGAWAECWRSTLTKASVGTRELINGHPPTAASETVAHRDCSLRLPNKYSAIEITRIAPALTTRSIMAC